MIKLFVIDFDAVPAIVSMINICFTGCKHVPLRSKPVSPDIRASPHWRSYIQEDRGGGCEFDIRRRGYRRR